MSNAGMDDVQQEPQVEKKWLVLSLIANLMLLTLVGGMVLFAFMLSYHLQDTKIQLTKANEDRQRLQTYLAESRAQAAEVEREISRLNQAFTGTDLSLTDSGKPPLPVQVRFRRSYLGIGLVAVIRNTSNRYLTLVMTARNPTLSRVNRFQVEIAPGDSLAFGHNDGWKFASGDELGLYHDSYKAFKLVVP